jgi:uncharacterized protein
MLLVFTRYPVQGQVKTRLIPAVGAKAAAGLHRRMTEHVVSVARIVAQDGNIHVRVCFCAGSAPDFRSWLGDGPSYAPQSHGDLGTRMDRALAQAFQGGAESAIVIGSDIPGLSPGTLRLARETLRRHDVVLGPSRDGGYYLIGVRRLHPELFTAMDWGTSRVREQTLDAISRLGLTVGELPWLADIDRPEDLDLVRTDARFQDILTRNPLISVIIPCLNEAPVLEETLEQVARLAGPGANLEVIVADGGSRDATRDIAARAGARVVRSDAGRAAQQNTGAAAARGRYLLFLHADTLLPRGYADAIVSALDDPAVVAGAFGLGIHGQRRALRLVEAGANYRSSFLQCPYGDQGLFMEKRIFEEMGGFASLPILEDFELVRRLRRRGKIRTLRQAVLTSARRWNTLGIMRTTVVNQIMIAGFLCGVPVPWLARLYRGRSRTG